MQDPKVYVLSLPECLGDSSQSVMDTASALFPSHSCQAVKCLGPDEEDSTVKCRVVFICKPDFTPDTDDLPYGWGVQEIEARVVNMSAASGLELLMKAIMSAAERYEQESAMPVIRNVNDKGMLN